MQLSHRGGYSPLRLFADARWRTACREQSTGPSCERDKHSCIRILRLLWGMGDNEVPCTNKTCIFSLELRPGHYQAVTRPLPGHYQASESILTTQTKGGA